MGTTPVMSLPYPEPGDPPAGPLQMQTLALGLEYALLDPVVGSVAAASNVSVTMTVRRVGAMTILTGGFSLSADKDANLTLFTLPVGFRPVAEWRATFKSEADFTTSATIKISTGGVATCPLALGSGTALYGAFSYFAVVS